MTYLECYENMKKCGLISSLWSHHLSLLDSIIGEKIDATKKEHVLILLELYFSFNESGDVYMTLDERKLKEKVANLIDKKRAEFEELYDEDAIQHKKEELQDKQDTLEKLRTEFTEAISDISELKTLTALVSLENEEKKENKLFVISNDRLFFLKYFRAVKKIVERMDALFPNCDGEEKKFDIGITIQLKSGQREAVEKGYNNNLLITGGPGTGKTTSIFFLLLSILKNDQNYNVYLTAPSGKAASRMRDSVLNNVSKLENPEDPAIKSIVKYISELKSYTIHHLLEHNFDDNGFLYREDHQFPENSIFVIDESSMTDVCVFASLLSAIPNGAKVYLMGDKDQLPSVECGAVFAELLEKYKNNTVTLTESNRFPETSTIYKLAKRFNEGKDLELKDDDFEDPIGDLKESTEETKELTGDSKESAKKPGFTIEEDAEEKNVGNLIKYYKDDYTPQKDIIDKIVEEWYKKYFKALREKCLNLSESDQKNIQDVFEESERAKILCACNEGIRGVKTINRRMIECQKKDMNPKKKPILIGDRYAGELLMITKNNKALDLYNGDSGVAVKFKGDETLYVMFKKESELKLDERTETNKGDLKNKIFKIGKDLVFYPLQMLSSTDIVPAFAITIHKSQGSDYKNILVILPKRREHPLLNRQIIYTAITRTKGNTYILSNLENLKAARDNKIERATGIL